uniref:Uncharacterized protein n=1 Tax=Romanomermis culicivorax TaxID=13658 RepID=A0A915HJS2_ROMCU
MISRNGCEPSLSCSISSLKCHLRRIKACSSPNAWIPRGQSILKRQNLKEIQRYVPERQETTEGIRIEATFIYTQYFCYQSKPNQPKKERANSSCYYYRPIFL